jgi:hypothetical protein
MSDRPLDAGSIEADPSFKTKKRTPAGRTVLDRLAQRAPSGKWWALKDNAGNWFLTENVDSCDITAVSAVSGPRPVPL